MLSGIELKRVMAEWQLRLQRVHAILNPPAWQEGEWCKFAQALTLLVKKHGSHWSDEETVHNWDMRWRMKEGGELVCQVEQRGEERVSLVVAQCGGFAGEGGSYTWLWTEFGPDGKLTREPYWVDGSWKEALMTLLMPFQYQANFLLAGREKSPTHLLGDRSER